MEANFTSSASTLPNTTPKKTKGESFLGVADLLLNIHGTKSLVSKSLGGGREKKGNVLYLRVLDRP